jgi:hypothetical protein
MRYISGNVSRFYGNSSSLSGNTRCIDGNVSRISGNGSRITGNECSITGNVSRIDGNVLSFYGNGPHIGGKAERFYGNKKKTSVNYWRIDGSLQGIETGSLTGHEEIHIAPTALFGTIFSAHSHESIFSFFQFSNQEFAAAYTFQRFFPWKLIRVEVR